MRQDSADRVLQQVFDLGINHIDTAASYGESELRLAPWLAQHRAGVFLATKTGERRGSEARAELERSLERLGVDRVDLIQLHNLVEEDEWEVAHGPGGAVEALAQARDEGLVDHIGVTGHGVRIAGMHLRSLDRFPFDSVLLPLNYLLMQRPDYRPDADALLARCDALDVAVQTIKSVARRRWPADYDGPKFSWYEPLGDQAAVDRAVRWALNYSPRVFVNSSSDARLLGLFAAAAGRPVAPTDDEMQADMTAHAVSEIFDGGDLERI
jgi:aryl-alcohol dehydrogenase-like predicted oxidoreductase